MYQISCVSTYIQSERVGFNVKPDRLGHFGDGDSETLVELYALYAK